MEVAVLVNVVEAEGDLLVDGGDETSSERTAFARLCELVEVALHALKDKVELFCRGHEECIVERDDVGMRRDGEERFELFELHALLPVGEGLLHLLDGDETLADVLGAGGGMLHGREHGATRKWALPVGEAYRAEGAVADVLYDGKVAGTFAHERGSCGGHFWWAERGRSRWPGGGRRGVGFECVRAVRCGGVHRTGRTRHVGAEIDVTMVLVVGGEGKG